MNISSIVSGALVMVLVTLTSGEEKKEKKPVEKLQIGVKLRVSADNCKMKTRKGDVLSMLYRGTLHKDDTEFDSNQKREDPFKFTLGTGQVIQGWDQGLLGMCIGEKRKLIVPPELGYGSSGAPPKIPANSALVFEVELLDISREGEL